MKKETCTATQLAAKPIFFSQELRELILTGQKTATRRLVKPQPIEATTLDGLRTGDNIFWNGHLSTLAKINGVLSPAPFVSAYHKGDIVYVPEAWRYESVLTGIDYGVRFRDDTLYCFNFDSPDRKQKWEKYKSKDGWISPYFMPRECARLFLAITRVGKERLQEITVAQAHSEGVSVIPAENAIHRFADMWNATLSVADKSIYGWEENPYVVTYRFEVKEI